MTDLCYPIPNFSEMVFEHPINTLDAQRMDYWIKNATPTPIPWRHISVFLGACCKRSHCLRIQFRTTLFEKILPVPHIPYGAALIIRHAGQKIFQRTITPEFLCSAIFHDTRTSATLIRRFSEFLSRRDDQSWGEGLCVVMFLVLIVDVMSMSFVY